MKERVNGSDYGFLPDYIAPNIEDVDFIYLKKQGVEACFYDLDHTLIIHGTHDVDQNVVDHLSRSELDIYIATNRRHDEKLELICQQIGAKAIMHSSPGGVAKPTKKYYGQAVGLTHHQPSELLMIGDRMIQDIWGANRSGLKTLLVGKFGPIKWWDQPISTIDRFIPLLFNKYYREVGK